MGLLKAEYYTKSISETFGQQNRDFSVGLRVYDISRPEQPHEIGFMPVEGLGLHRLWCVGGCYAYASALDAGLRSRQALCSAPCYCS